MVDREESFYPVIMESDEDGQDKELESDIKTEPLEIGIGNNNGKNSYVEIMFGPEPPFLPEYYYSLSNKISDLGEEQNLQSNASYDVNCGSAFSLCKVCPTRNTNENVQNDSVTDAGSHNSGLLTLTKSDDISSSRVHDHKYLASADGTDISEKCNDRSRIEPGLMLTVDDVINLCTGSSLGTTNVGCHSEPGGLESVNKGVVTADSIRIKTEPEMDGYADPKQMSGPEETKSLFVSTENGQMFLQSEPVKLSQNDNQETRVLIRSKKNDKFVCKRRKNRHTLKSFGMKQKTVEELGKMDTGVDVSQQETQISPLYHSRENAKIDNTEQKQIDKADEETPKKQTLCCPKKVPRIAANNTTSIRCPVASGLAVSSTSGKFLIKETGHTSAHDTLIDTAFMGFEDDMSCLDKTVRGIIEEEITRLSSKNDKADQCVVKREPEELTNSDVTARSSAVSTDIGSSPNKTLLYSEIKKDMNALSDEKEVCSPEAITQATLQKNSNPIPVACIRNENVDPEIQATDSNQNVRDDCNDSNEERGGNYVLQELNSDQPVKSKSVGQMNNNSEEQEDIKCVNLQTKVKLIKVANTNCKPGVKVMKFGGNAKLVKIAKESTLSPQNQNSKHHIYSVSSDQKHLVSHQKNGDFSLYSKSVNVKHPNAKEQNVVNMEATTEKPDHMVPLLEEGVTSFSTATPEKRTVYLHPYTGKTYKKVTLPEEGTRSPASTATPETITVYRDHSTGKFYDTSTQPGYRVDASSSAVSNAGKRKIIVKTSTGKTYHMVPLSKEGVRSPPSSACATKNTVSLSRESVWSPSSRPCTMENTVSLSKESAGTPSSSPCTMKGTKVMTDHTPVHAEKLVCPVGNSAAKEAVVCMDPSYRKTDKMVSILQNKVNSPSVPASTKSVTQTKLEPVQARWGPVKPTIVRLTPVNQSSVKPVLVLKTLGLNTILNKAVPAQTSVKQTQEKPVLKPSDKEMGWEKTPQENHVKMIVISDTSAPLQKIVAPQIGTLRLKGLPLMETVLVMVKDMCVQTDTDDLNSDNDSRDLSIYKVSTSLTENTLSSPTSIETGCTKSVATTTSSVTVSSDDISFDKSECVEQTNEDVDLIMDVEEAEDVDSDIVGDQLNDETFQDSVLLKAESQNIKIDKNKLSAVKIEQDCRRKFTETGLDLLTCLRARVRKRYHWRNLDTRSCGVNTAKTGSDDAVVTRELFNTIIGSKYYSYNDLYRNLKTYLVVPDKQKQRKRCVQKFIRRKSFLLEQKKLYEDKLQRFKERCGNQIKTAKTKEQTSQSSAAAATGNITGKHEKMAAAPGRISDLQESMETDMAKFFDDSAMLKDLEEIGTTDYESDSSDDEWKVVIENKISCDEHASATINSATHSSLLCDSSREIITMNEVGDNMPPIKKKDTGKIDDDVIKDYCHNLGATEVNSKEKDKEEETMCEEFNEKLCLNVNCTQSNLYSTLCEIEEQADESDHFTDTIGEKNLSCLPEVTHKSLPTQFVNVLDNSAPVLQEASCRQLLKHSPGKQKSQMILSQFRSEVKSKSKSPDIIIRSPPKSPEVKLTAVVPEIIVRSLPKSPEVKATDVSPENMIRSPPKSPGIKSTAVSFENRIELPHKFDMVESTAVFPEIIIRSPPKSPKVISVPESVEVTCGSQSVSPEIKSTEISFWSPLKSPSVKSSAVSPEITCKSTSKSPSVKTPAVSPEITCKSTSKSPSVKSSAVSPEITCKSTSKSPSVKTPAVSPEITCKSTSKSPETMSMEISLWSPLKSPFVKTPAVYSEIMIGSPPESPNTKSTEVTLGSPLKSPMVCTSAVSPEIMIGSSPQSQETTKSLMELPDVESRNLICWSPLTAPDMSPLPKSPDVTSKSLFDDEFTSESLEVKSRFRSVEVTFWSPLRSPAVKLPSTTSDINPVTLPEITFRVPSNSLGIESTPLPQEMNFKSPLKSPEIISKSPHKSPEITFRSPLKSPAIISKSPHNSPEITFRSPLKSPKIESGPLSPKITFRSPLKSPEIESGAVSPEITFRSTLQSSENESGPLSPEITFRSPLKSPEIESGAVSPEVTFRSLLKSPEIESGPLSPEVTFRLPQKSPEIESGAVSPEVTFRPLLKSPEIESGPLSPYIAFKSPLKSSEMESAALPTEVSFSSPTKPDEIESGPLYPDVTFRSPLESPEIESRQLSAEITFRSPAKSPETKSTLVPPEIIFLSPCKSLKIKSKALHQNMINKSSHTSHEIRSILLSSKIKDVRLPSSRYLDIKEERFSKVAWSQKGKCGLANFTVIEHRDEIKEVDLNNNEKPVSVPTFPCDSSKPHHSDNHANVEGTSAGGHTDSDDLFVDVKPLDLSVSRSSRACDKGCIEGLYSSQKQPDVLGAPVNLLKQLDEYRESQTDNKRIDPDAFVESCSMDNTVRRKRKGICWSTEQFQMQKKCKRPELKTKYTETIQVSPTEYGQSNQASCTRHGPKHQVSGTEHSLRHQVTGTEHGPRHQVSGTGHGPKHQFSGTEHGSRHQVSDTGHGPKHQFSGTEHGPRHQVSGTGHGPKHQFSGTEHGPRHQVSGIQHGPRHQVNCTRNDPIQQVTCTGNGPGHQFIGTKHGSKHHVIGTDHGRRREVNGSRIGPIHLFSSTENTTRHQASNDRGHQASYNDMFEAKRQERDLMYQLYSSELSFLQSNPYPQIGNSVDKTSDSSVMWPLLMHQGSNPVRDNWEKDNSSHCPLTTMPDMHGKLSYPLQHKLPYMYQENHSSLVDKNGNIVNTIDIQGQNKILQGQSHILTTDQYRLTTAGGHPNINACTLDQSHQNFSGGQGQASTAEGQGQDAVYCDKVSSLQHPSQFMDVTFQGQSNDLPLDLSVSNRCQRVPCTDKYQHSSISLDVNKCSGTTENSIYGSHGDIYNTQFNPMVNSIAYRIPQILSNLRLPGNVPELQCQQPLPLPGCIICNDFSVAAGNVPTVRRPVIDNSSEVTRARLRSRKCGHLATSAKEKGGRNCTKKQSQRKGRKQKLQRPCLEHTQEEASQYNRDRLVQDKITESMQSKVRRSNKVSVNLSPAMLSLDRSCSDLGMSDPQRKSCCDTSGSTGSCSVLHPSCSETVTSEQDKLESLMVPGNRPFRPYKVDNGTVHSKEPSHLCRSAMPGSLDDHGKISAGELGSENVKADNGKLGLTSFHSVVGENITAKKSINYKWQMAYPAISIPPKYCEMSPSENQKPSTKDVSTSEMIQEFVTNSFIGDSENGFSSMSRNSDEEYSSSSAGRFLTPLSQNLAPAHFRMLGLAGQSYALKDTEVESGRELSVVPNVEPRTHFNDNISITWNKNHIVSMASAGNPRLSYTQNERIYSHRNLDADPNRMYEMMMPVDSSKSLNSVISMESAGTSELSNLSKIDAVGHPGDSSHPGRLCTCTSKSRTPCTVSSCIVLAANRAMTTEHPVSHDWSRKGTDQQETDLSEHCCSCSSRGKCRSCVCCKTGCYNCRNKLCCFKDKGVYVFPLPLKNGTKNRRSRTKKSALARKKEKTGSHELSYNKSSKASSKIGQRIVDQSNNESLTANISAPCVMDRLCENNDKRLSSVLVEHHGKSSEPIRKTGMNTQMDKCVQESGWTDRQGGGIIGQDLVECQNKIVKEGQKRKGNLPGGNICLPEGGKVKKRRSSISAGFDVLPSQTLGRDVSSELINRVVDRQKSNGRKEGGKDEKDKGNDDSSVSRHFHPSNCDHDENNNEMEEVKEKVMKRRVFEHETVSENGKEKIKRIKVIDKTKDLEKNIQTDENNNIDEQQGTGCENKILSSTFHIADEQTSNLLLPPMTCVRTVSPMLLKNSEGKRNCKKPIRKRKIDAEVKTVSLPKKSLNTCSDAMLLENPPSAVCKQMSRDANNNTTARVETELPITAEKESLKSSNRISVTKSPKRTKKKGRPRTKFSPKKESKPNIVVKLEDHTDKYEVAQYTSQHKKDRNVELQLKSFERFSCLLCQGIYQYSTPDRDSMEKHLAQHLSGKLTCGECGKTFSQAIHVQEHCQREHKTANFTCEQCAHQFFNKSTLKRHLCKEHGQKLYTCKKCPERYSSMIEMKNHVYEVHVGEATRCDKCGTISLSKKAAMFHSQSKTCEGQALINVPCPYCHSVLSQSQMAHHIKRIHLRIHIYKCDICPYTTLSRTALNNHTMMHQGVHPFRCELCPFSCVKSYQLSSHMRTHTGDKPYRCDQCSYAAAWNVQLKDHMRAHQSVDSIHCEECGILYRNQRCLNNHNRKVHKQKEDSHKTRKKSKS